MDLPLSDQVLSLIRTVISLAVAVATVLGFTRYGFALASAYYGVGLSAFVMMQLALGRSMRTRTAPPAPATTDDTDTD